MITKEDIGGMQKNKNRDIALEIRRRILTGKLKPEEQLPTRMELEREFKVSRVTMQKAIDSLVADGTVYAKGTSGTFVSKCPMEIYHYGLVFHHKPDADRPWSRQWKIILQEAEKLFSKTPYRLSVFYGDKYYLNANGNADFIENIRDKRMAGLILTMSPEFFEGSEIIGDPEIPKLTIIPGKDTTFPSVIQDSSGMLKDMARHLSDMNRKKTSLIMYSRQFHEPSYLEDAVKELKKAGIETHDFWIHGVDILHPKSGANITRLMMRDEKFRPDSIIILDDNLIPGVIKGLHESNLHIPDDVELVAMANFPYNEKLKAPVKMFGFNIPEQLRLAKIKLDAMRQGMKYEKKTIIKYVSNTEFDMTGKTNKI